MAWCIDAWDINLHRATTDETSLDSCIDFSENHDTCIQWYIWGFVVRAFPTWEPSTPWKSRAQIEKCQAQCSEWYELMEVWLITERWVSGVGKGRCISWLLINLDNLDNNVSHIQCRDINTCACANYHHIYWHEQIDIIIYLVSVILIQPRTFFTRTIDFVDFFLIFDHRW